jgi:O-antigen ligase
VAVAICAVVYGALVLGLATALSRAGLILGLVAGAASLAMIWPSGFMRSQTQLTKSLVMAGLCAVVLSQIALLVALGERGTLGDATRLQMARITLRAALDYFPIGSGFGTFVPVFGMFQGPESAFSSYVNHAHDDWLELWLEGGVPAAALMLAFLAWSIMALRPIWRPAGERALTALLFPRAASIVVALLLAHSFVDYPLRTIAMACVFALACGLLIAPIEAADLEESSTSPRTPRTRAEPASG